MRAIVVYLVLLFCELAILFFVI